MADDNLLVDEFGNLIGDSDEEEEEYYFNEEEEEDDRPRRKDPAQYERELYESNTKKGVYSNFFSKKAESDHTPYAQKRQFIKNNQDPATDDARDFARESVYLSEHSDEEGSFQQEEGIRLAKETPSCLVKPVSLGPQRRSFPYQPSTAVTASCASPLLSSSPLSSRVSRISNVSQAVDPRSLLKSQSVEQEGEQMDEENPQRTPLLKRLKQTESHGSTEPQEGFSTDEDSQYLST